MTMSYNVPDEKKAPSISSLKPRVNDFEDALKKYYFNNNAVHEKKDSFFFLRTPPLTSIAFPCLTPVTSCPALDNSYITPAWHR